MVKREKMHGARYGEVLLVSFRWTHLEAAVYNTLGLNDCPDKLWKELDPNVIRKEHKVRAVILNGPRYFLMDATEVESPIEHEPVTFGHLAMRRLATVRIPLLKLMRVFRRKPYTENDVVRTTVYTFNAGREVYELLSPDGRAYVMQSYSLQIDPTLTEERLKSLDKKLAMPKGWQYRVRQLQQDWHVRAEGLAYVLQDELQNSYQRII